MRRPPRSTLFPYPTLCRSRRQPEAVPVGRESLRASTAEMRPKAAGGCARWTRVLTGIDSRDATEGSRRLCPLDESPYGHRQQRCDRRQPEAVPVGRESLRASTAEMRPKAAGGCARWTRVLTGIDSRDATEGSRRLCPLDESPYGHRQQRCDRRQPEAVPVGRESLRASTAEMRPKAAGGCARWTRVLTGIDSRDATE